MRIEEGKKYITRGGSVVGPLERVKHGPNSPADPTWVWAARNWLGGEDGAVSYDHWMKEGAFSASGVPHAMDLVAEWEPFSGAADAAAKTKDASAPEPPMTKHRLLDLAKEATADRGLNYGKPEDNFARIAERWTVHIRNSGLLNRKELETFRLLPVDVAIMCADLKLARLENQPAHKDSWVDVAGYAACGAEIALGSTPNRVIR